MQRWRLSCRESFRSGIVLPDTQCSSRLFRDWIRAPFLKIILMTRWWGHQVAGLDGVIVMACPSRPATQAHARPVTGPWQARDRPKTGQSRVTRNRCRSLHDRSACSSPPQPSPGPQLHTQRHWLGYGCACARHEPCLTLVRSENILLQGCNPHKDLLAAACSVTRYRTAVIWVPAWLAAVLSLHLEGCCYHGLLFIPAHDASRDPRGMLSPHGLMSIHMAKRKMASSC